jgi:hypothetical protein
VSDGLPVWVIVRLSSPEAVTDAVGVGVSVTKDSDCSFDNVVVGDGLLVCVIVRLSSRESVTEDVGVNVSVTADNDHSLDADDDVDVVTLDDRPDDAVDVPVAVSSLDALVVFEKVTEMLSHRKVTCVMTTRNNHSVRSRGIWKGTLMTK